MAGQLFGNNSRVSMDSIGEGERDALICIGLTGWIAVVLFQIDLINFTTPAESRYPLKVLVRVSIPTGETS